MKLAPSLVVEQPNVENRLGGGVVYTVVCGRHHARFVVLLELLGAHT